MKDFFLFNFHSWFAHIDCLIVEKRRNCSLIFYINFYVCSLICWENRGFFSIISKFLVFILDFHICCLVLEKRDKLLFSNFLDFLVVWFANKMGDLFFFFFLFNFKIFNFHFQFSHFFFYFYRLIFSFSWFV